MVSFSIFFLTISIQLFFDHFNIEDNEKSHTLKNGIYQVKRQFPNINFHYRKNCRIVGGVDLNQERFDSEYAKKYLMRWEDYKDRNKPYYQMALAAK